MTNRFKGLDLINRVPEELWMEFITLYRRQWSKPSTRKRNAKGQNGALRRLYKWLRKVAGKGKGEKERYAHLNAEYQRIARRDNKAFLSDQSKEIEGKLWCNLKSLFLKNCWKMFKGWIFFFPLGMVLIPVSSIMSQTSIHSSLGTLSNLVA